MRNWKRRVIGAACFLAVYLLLGPLTAQPVHAGDYDEKIREAGGLQGGNPYHDHSSYIQTQFDETGHAYYCCYYDCGARTDTVPHSLVWERDDLTHRCYCEDCGHSLVYGEHHWVQSTESEGAVCADCGATREHWLTGTLSIDGAPKIGEIVTANISGLNLPVSDPKAVCYRWYADCYGEREPVSSEASLVIRPEYTGSKLYLEVYVPEGSAAGSYAGVVKYESSQTVYGVWSGGTIPGCTHDGSCFNFSTDQCWFECGCGATTEKKAHVFSAEVSIEGHLLHCAVCRQYKYDSPHQYVQQEDGRYLCEECGRSLSAQPQFTGENYLKLTGSLQTKSGVAVSIEGPMDRQTWYSWFMYRDGWRWAENSTYSRCCGFTFSEDDEGVKPLFVVVASNPAGGEYLDALCWSEDVTVGGDPEWLEGNNPRCTEHNSWSIAATEEGHYSICWNCGAHTATEAHVMEDWGEVVDTSSHRFRCVCCGYTVTEPHSFIQDSETGVIHCTACNQESDRLLTGPLGIIGQPKVGELLVADISGLNSSELSYGWYLAESGELLSDSRSFRLGPYTVGKTLMLRVISTDNRTSGACVAYTAAIEGLALSGGEADHVHEFYGWQSTESGHYYECMSCGARSEMLLHVEAPQRVAQELTHSNRCFICQHLYQAEPHTWWPGEEDAYLCTHCGEVRLNLLEGTLEADGKAELGETVSLSFEPATPEIRELLKGLEYYVFVRDEQGEREVGWKHYLPPDDPFQLMLTEETLGKEVVVRVCGYNLDGHLMAGSAELTLPAVTAKLSGGDPACSHEAFDQVADPSGHRYVCRDCGASTAPMDHCWECSDAALWHGKVCTVCAYALRQLHDWTESDGICHCSCGLTVPRKMIRGDIRYEGSTEPGSTVSVTAESTNCGALLIWKAIVFGEDNELYAEEMLSYYDPRYDSPVTFTLPSGAEAAEVAGMRMLLIAIDAEGISLPGFLITELGLTTVSQTVSVDRRAATVDKDGNPCVLSEEEREELLEELNRGNSATANFADEEILEKIDLEKAMELAEAPDNLQPLSVVMDISLTSIILDDDRKLSGLDFEVSPFVKCSENGTIGGVTLVPVDNEAITETIFFRLPIPAGVNCNEVVLYHNGELMEGTYPIETDNEGNRYVEVEAAAFSVYTCEFVLLPYILGSFDGNETVDVNDALYLLLHSFYPEDYPLNQGADYTGDGKVDVNDALHLLLHTFYPKDYPLTTVRVLATVPRKEELL